MPAGTVTITYREGSQEQDSFKVADVEAVATAFKNHLDTGFRVAFRMIRTRSSRLRTAMLARLIFDQRHSKIQQNLRDLSRFVESTTLNYAKCLKRFSYHVLIQKGELNHG